MWSESLLWALHAVHHSQRQMTMGSDKRNHVLDDLLRNSLIVLVSQLIGMAPAQFVTIVAITQLTESLSHTNVRLSFGRWGQRLVGWGLAFIGNIIRLRMTPHGPVRQAAVIFLSCFRSGT